MSGVTSSTLVERLDQGAAALGVVLDAGTRQRLMDYLALILKWNKVYNLTAVRQPEDMLGQHLLDSLAVLPPLQRHWQQHGPVDGVAPRLLDVGSGAGLPGVVLAIVAPQWQLHCVDTVGKKASFIQQVATELKLKNLHAHHARVEQLRLPAFDVVTSRAFASLLDFTQLTQNLLAPEGCWMAMKGKQPADEIAALPADVNVFHVEQLQVPGLDAERCLVWLHRGPSA